MNDMSAITPPATIGMIGGGQLGRYALVAARQMGYRTVVLDPDEAAPAGAVADLHLVAGYEDEVALAEMARRCAVVTIEFENPPHSALELLAASVRVAPSAAAVRVVQDRILEKRFLEAFCPVGPWAPLERADDLDRVRAELDGPAVVKTARFGYDGKGQQRIDSLAELDRAWEHLGSVPCVVETLVPLVTELSVVAGRSANGDRVVYPVTENVHVDGVLDVSVVPAAVDADVVRSAATLADQILERLDYVGVLAVEMFVTSSQEDGVHILVNEIAPRPHNSGHWTIDAAYTSQFEQQVRAVCGLTLGDPGLTAPAAAMANLLGDLWAGGEPRWERAVDRNVALHLYGKQHPRPGRKMGHLTALGERDRVVESVRAARSRLVSTSAES